MKLNRKSFGVKLWLYFVGFAAIIFAALWLLQTVFLQSFYNSMAIHNIKQVALQIAEQQDSDVLDSLIEDYALEYSLLIFLTDWNGNVIYSADEHSSVYEKHQNWNIENNSGGNPYRNSDEPMNWQIGAYRNLPQNYSDFLEQLSSSQDGTIGFPTENNTAYVYGMVLPDSVQFGSEKAVLYISMQLGAVGATTSILRIQLIWVTFVSFVIAFIIAYFLSRQFSRPIFAISTQAKRMVTGEFVGDYERGFCQELDNLSATLEETTAALQQLENARRELLANVSHDLRTPLTMIKGYAEMIRDISWNDESRRDDDLAIIIREADRLTGLVNDILEYSAMQSRNLSVEFESLDLSSIVQCVAEQFIPLCEQSDCEIKISLEPRQWVNGNEKLLKRVLYNLIDNAVSHSGNNKIYVSLRKAGLGVRVEIRDFGPGIPEEELPYIWDRYFTSKNRRSDINKSGLGLAITKSILLMFEADFGVDSKLGQGSIFWFELKKVTPEPKAEEGRMKK